MRLPMAICRRKRDGQGKVDRGQRRISRRPLLHSPLSAIHYALLRLSIIHYALPALFAGAGCGPQVIYQTATGPVRLAEPINARIWVKTPSGGWVKSANRVAIPEGFDVLPPPPAVRAPNPPGVSLPDACVPKH